MNSIEDSIFGDFVDFNSSNKSLKTKIDKNIDLVIDELNVDIKLIQKNIEEPKTDNGTVNFLETSSSDPQRCQIIYDQVFNSSLYNHQNSTDDLDHLLQNSHTYKHLIHILAPYLTSKVVNVQNNLITPKQTKEHDTSINIFINDYVEKIMTTISQLDVASTDEAELDSYFMDLKNTYMNLIIKNNNHLSVLTDHKVLEMTLQLIKEKIITQNLLRDNDVYKTVVRNFIEQSNKKHINKLKKQLNR